MSPKAILWIAIAVIAAAWIPCYGWMTGHWAEMMGGRMLLWGVAWMFILFVEAMIILTLAGRALLRRRD